MLTVLVAGLCAAGAHDAAAVTPYRVTDLGTLGGTFSVANAIIDRARNNLNNWSV